MIRFDSVDDLYLLQKIIKRNMATKLEVIDDDISIGTYNILQSYQVFNKKYESKKNPTILWIYRWELIKRELKMYNLDIICFQEVQNDLFLRDILPFLATLGYMGYFVPIEPKLKENKLDEYSFFSYNYSGGIATFFKIEKFRIINIKSFDYFRYAKKKLKADSRMEDPDFVKKLNSSFANITLLLEKLNDKKRFHISNVHIINKPSFDDVKTLMFYFILKYNSNNIKNDPFILCGDFNSLPSSQVYKGITTGKISNVFEFDVNKSITPVLPIIKLKTHFTKNMMKSAYFEMFGKEPSYTNYTEKFKETLDYIFVNKHCQIVAVLEEPNIDHKTEIPDEDYPSDHIIQIAIIRI